MKMVWHEDKFVKAVSVPSMLQEIFEEQARPRLCMEKRTPLPRVRRDEVRLRVVCCVFAYGFQNLPPGAKARLLFSSLRHD